MGVLVLAAASAGAARQASGQELLEQARRALGGEALAAVRTLRVEGQSTRVVGPLRLSSAVELLLDRPIGSSGSTACGWPVPVLKPSPGSTATDSSSERRVSTRRGPETTCHSTSEMT
jgi:hypothetical protein